MIDFRSKEIQNLIGNGGQSNLSSSILGLDKKLDEHFGIDYDRSEKEILSTNEDLYIGLESGALLTSYLDYYQILNDLELGQILVDIGAGYCRGSLLSKDCISVEVVAERVLTAKSSLLNLDRDPSCIIQADLLDPNYRLPRGDAYFLYVPTGNLLNSFLRKCIEQNITALFYVIESHGDFNTILSVYQEFIQELDSKLQCSLPRHDSTIRKYQFDSSLMSKNEYQKLTIHQELDPESLPLWLLKFFDHKDLVYNFESKNIDADNFHQWQGSTEGSHLVSYNQKIALQIYSPFKIVQINDMDRIFGVRAINSGI